MIELLHTHALTALILIPALVTAGLCLVPASRANLIRTVSCLGAGLTMVIAVWLFFAYDQAANGFQFVFSMPWVPDLGIQYKVGADGVSVAMVLLTSIVYLAGALVSTQVKVRVKDFYVLLSALVTGVFGVFVSLDLFIFYFFYELAVVPMYLLIGYWGSSNREYATMKLTLYLTVGALVALFGLLMLYFSGITETPTFDLTQILAAVEAGNGLDVGTQKFLFPLLLVGFATIAPMWPLHSWSPGGHAAAPSAASMMHAGVLMKLGSYAIIRIALPVLPEGAVTWLPWVAVLCCFNIIYGGYVAMSQRDMKFVIGYSSSSHMGYVLLGIASISVLGMSGAVFLMFAHGVMTAMASLGLPGFANFASELMVIVGSWERYPIPTTLAVFGLVIGATYLLRTVRAAFQGPLDPRWADLKDAKGPLQRAPFLLLCGTLLLFGIYPAPMVDLISGSIQPVVDALLAAEAGLSI